MDRQVFVLVVEPCPDYPGMVRVRLFAPPVEPPVFGQRLGSMSEPDQSYVGVATAALLAAQFCKAEKPGQWNSTRIYRYLDQPWFTLTNGSGKPVTRLSGQYRKWSDGLLAAVQGFPPGYAGLTHRMIGNAIPPELTRPWGQILRRAYGLDQSVVSLFCGAGGGDYGLLEGAA